MIERYNVRSLLLSRSTEKSFHVAAEQHVRVEFRNMSADQEIGPLTYAGDIILTCYRGQFRVDSDTHITALQELDQAIVPHGTPIRLRCEVEGTIQIIWSPGYAQTTQGINDCLLS
jgi:hypothetical protein